MGHTVLSQRQVLDMLLRELQAYGKALRVEDRVLLDELLHQPLKHYGSISYASSLHSWAFFLLSINLEQQRQIKKLERQYARLAHRRVSEQEQDSPLVQNT